MKNKIFKTAGTLVAGLALAIAAPAAGLAAERGGHGGGGSHYNGGGHSEGAYRGGGHYRGGGEYRGNEHYDHDRGWRGGGRYYYGGGSGAYYNYAAPAYGYNNGCGYYDAYGYWHADPYCAVPY